MMPIPRVDVAGTIVKDGLTLTARAELTDPFTHGTALAKQDSKTQTQILLAMATEIQSWGSLQAEMQLAWIGQEVEALTVGDRAVLVEWLDKLLWFCKEDPDTPQPPNPSIRSIPPQEDQQP